MKSNSMFRLLFSTILFVTAFLSGQQTMSQTVVVTNPTSPFTVPAGVTSIKVEAWGGGGAGGGTTGNSLGTRLGGGGGGGAYNTATFTVSPGQTYTIVKGTGGTGLSGVAGTAGTASSVSGAGGTLTANAGLGGGLNGGSGAGGAGIFNGGTGSSGGSSTGGGGGGGAGNAGNGGNGVNGIGSVGGAGGTGSPNSAPYKGGAGGANQAGSNSSGLAGSAPGGAGGGSYTFFSTSTRSGGAGGAGQVVITYCSTVAPGVSSLVTYCQGASAVPLTASGTALKWYTVPTGGTGSASAPTPSTASVGTTSYYVSQTIGCEGPRATINVTINGNSTIGLTSASGTNAQSVCIDNPITDITYSIGGTGTGASITAGGLPTGVTGSFNSGVFTISGTPLNSGVFNYTVTATGVCPVSVTGSITIQANSTIALSSAAGSDGQTLCALTALSNITYSVGGGGNSASITAGALPAGVTGSFNGGVFTITGTPTETGIFNYTVTTSGPCINTSAGGTITVNESSTITLSSAAGTNAQTLCVDNALTDITYAIGGSSTGGSLTGGSLPSGVNGTFSSGIFTISGIPTVAGVFNYTITATGQCPVFISGNITVNANSIINLSSEAGSDNQSLCEGVAMTNITYAIAGGGNGASISAGVFPTGVTGSYNSGVYTISGTPTQTGVFNYTITTSGPCINASLNGSITVVPSSTILLTSATGTDGQTACINTSITDITYSMGGSATGGSLSGGSLPAGVLGSFNGGVFTISGSPSESGSFAYTVTATGSCPVSLSGSLLVNANSTITLSSANGTEAQTLCINTPLTNISYAIGGGGTGAVVTGLPAGLSSSYNAGVFTLNGIPNVAGTFAFTVTTTGPCINASLNGTVTVIGDGTIGLTSGAGSNIQTVCIDNPIVDITYLIGGTATGATITSGSLPPGVSGNFDTGVFTITGTPTVSGLYNYTVSTTGSPCINSTLNGTITVQANSTINLLSGNDNQTICINTILGNIVYAIGGNGTGAGVTGLPAGVTGTFSGGAFTISGTPTAAGTFNYTVTTTGPCINTSATGTITVTGNSTLTLTSANNNQGVCQNSAIANINYNYGGSATAVNTSGLPPGVSGAISGAVYIVSGTPTTPGIYNFTLITTGPCVNRTRTGTITVNPQPTLVSIAPTSSTICVGNSQPLTASATTSSVAVVNENFNGTSTFTAAGTSSGDRSQIFGSVASGTTVLNIATFTNGAGNLMVSTVGSSNTLGAGSVSSTLTSPVINASGYTLSTLTFNHTYKSSPSGTNSGKVEVSTNGGSTWATLSTYTTNQGSSGAFTGVSLNLAAYSNNVNLRIRFNFTSAIQNLFSNDKGWWAVDDVVLNGTPIALYSWIASTAAGVNGLPANAGTPLTTNKNITVNPTATTTYTLSASNQATGCAVNTVTSTVNVNQNSTITLTSATGTNSQSVCIPNAANDITYEIGGGGTGASITSGTLPAGMSGSFNSGVFTISGSPTVTGNYAYTITTTGPCVNVTASGSITVKSAPQLTCPANDITNTDPGVCHATRSYSAGVTGVPTPSVSYIINGNFISFPYDFPTGITTVDVLAEGACSPDANCSFTVTVNDLEAPLADITSLPDATGECAVTVTDIPTATDACDGLISGTTSDPLIYNAQGTYVITWTYTDTKSNVSTQTQTVIVNDITAPSITCPSSQTFCAVAGNNYTIPLLVTTDNCTIGSITYQITGATSRIGNGNDASGIFNTGTSTITWTVTDGNNNSSNCSTSVTINFVPSVPVVTGTVNVCPYLGTGDQVTYIASAPGATSYTWTLPPNVVLVSGQGTANLVVTFNSGFSSQANKQLRVTASSVCGTSSMTIFYLLTQNPTTPNPITGPVNVCDLIGTATLATYTIPAAISATSYVWSTPAGTSVIHPNGSGVNDTTINVTFNNSFAGGPISVTAVNGCGTSGTRTLNIPRIPSSVPGLISGPTNVCANILPGGTAATYSIVQVAGATSYTWTAPVGSVVTHPNGTGPNDFTITIQYPVGFNNGTISVSSTNGCGTSGLRTLAVNKLNPATPSVIDVIQSGFCGDPGGRVYTYTLSTIPANATSVQWTVPTSAGAVLVSGQGNTSITVSYPSTAVQGNVTAQAVNNCATSTIRSSSVKLGACPPPGFSKTGNDQKIDKISHAAPLETKMDVKIFPNPSVNDFKLQVLTTEKELINIRIVDLFGKEFKNITAMPYQTISIGADLKAGSYLVEIIQGKNRTIEKVIKF